MSGENSASANDSAKAGDNRDENPNADGTEDCLSDDRQACAHDRQPYASCTGNVDSCNNIKASCSAASASGSEPNGVDLYEDFGANRNAKSASGSNIKE